MLPPPYVRKWHPDIFHSLDVWHKSKKIRKALAKAGKVKNMNKLQQWGGNIINHFWHCCKTCEGDPMKLKIKWSSILQHVQMYINGILEFAIMSQW